MAGMKSSLVLALALAPLAAQDRPTAPARDLSGFRAAFATAATKGPVIAIACVPGSEPVILTAGSDAGGQELSPQSLLPLLALGKVLAADAIAAQYKDKVDKGSGERFGGTELTVRELLQGTTLLPDYFVLDGTEGSADAALLRACGEVAAGAKLQLRATSLGAAEFVLLEPMAFGGRYQDWQSMLRSTFAPRVPGLDPLTADALTEAARARLTVGAEDFAKLSAAKPALLRTVLSVKDLATWWQWRAQQDAQLWTSARMGRLIPARTNPREQRWTLTCMAMNCNLLASQYPSQKAGLVWIGAGSYDPVVKAFEADVFPAAEAGAAPAAGAFAGGVAAAARPPVPGAQNPLAGTSWCNAPAPAGSPMFKLTFGAGPKDPIVTTLGPDSTSFANPAKTGDGMSASGRSGDGSQRTLWLWPQPDGEKPARLGVVLVTTRMAGMATAAGGLSGSSVPQYLELVPEAK